MTNGETLAEVEVGQIKKDFRVKSNIRFPWSTNQIAQMKLPRSDRSAEHEEA